MNLKNFLRILNKEIELLKTFLKIVNKKELKKEMKVN